MIADTDIIMLIFACRLYDTWHRDPNRLYAESVWVPVPVGPCLGVSVVASTQALS